MRMDARTIHESWAKHGQGMSARMNGFMLETHVNDDATHGAEVRCPNCGSGEVHQFRMGIIRYRLGRDGGRFERVMDDSEDTVFHRCIDCHYGSDTDAWERPGTTCEKGKFG
jgi:hypothetical protein